MKKILCPTKAEVLRAIFSMLLSLSLFLAYLTISVTPHAANADEPQVFTFTAIPDQDASQLRQRFSVVADYLSQQLGMPVKYIPVKSYAAAVTAFRNNQVQLAWFGGLSGVRARSLVVGSEAIAQGIEDPHFKSYFIANTRTGLKPSDDFPLAMLDHTFTFGSKGSTSGRLMPEYYIRQNSQRSPEEFFKRVGFSGDHSRTIALVEAGSFDIGAVNYKVWERAVAEGKVDTKRVEVIWQTPDYPDYHWTIRGDIDNHYGAGSEQKLRHALLNMNQPALLAAFPRSGFIAANNNDFQPIEEVARALGLLRR
ncbi:phosphonate transport system substrate-binding protein [Sinobacterium caligoides]|uniref:Phosphonate transport system substrate-binding protein n=1 Tax=Sinobacterium caligoides TaxID=933926 RepID=A0A3N2DGU8_9GAMM|nr:putative selenate ABC transporter substrate-binding protein [Sinobacterium caligoides]ROR98961.1 phosphonate transport system substrate-binding protein [Sinobacterium caligoides]